IIDRIERRTFCVPPPGLEFEVIQTDFPPTVIKPGEIVTIRPRFKVKSADKEELADRTVINLKPTDEDVEESFLSCVLILYATPEELKPFYEIVFKRPINSKLDYDADLLARWSDSDKLSIASNRPRVIEKKSRTTIGFVNQVLDYLSPDRRDDQ